MLAKLSMTNLLTALTATAGHLCPLMSKLCLNNISKLVVVGNQVGQLNFGLIHVCGDGQVTLLQHQPGAVILQHQPPCWADKVDHVPRLVLEGGEAYNT